MTSINRVIVSGGGTGGHIYPALSIFRALKADNPSIEGLYIGSQLGLEADIVPREEISFESINIQGIERRLTFNNLKSLYYMGTSSIKIGRRIKEFKPDIVIGTGGYVCAPVILAASLQKIPTFIHEQNSVAGMANKFLARYVDKIGICFEEVRHDFGRNANKCVLTGNPRAQEILEIDSEEKILEKQFGLNDYLPTVLIFGGSRGAPAINQAVLESIELFKQAKYQVIIATGQVHYDEIFKQIKSKMSLPNNVKIVPYIDNMPQIFQSVDLIVSRSGATTLTEITALGLPSILIPSPYVTNNHQEYNANVLVKNQAARMIREAELNGPLLYQQISEIMADQSTLMAMSKQSKQLATPHALDDILKELKTLIIN